MQQLGANAIRVYHVDPTADHTSCMTTFANAGIYLFVDLDTFDTQINQDYPVWNQTQVNAFERVMDEFQRYDNTAGFLVGNEVLTQGKRTSYGRRSTCISPQIDIICSSRLSLWGDSRKLSRLETNPSFAANGSVAAPYVKAAVRDMKAYRDSKKYRNIPIGYSAADIAQLRPMLQNYLACGDNPADTIDYFCLNAYEWCGDNTYAGSGYNTLTSYVTNYSIPIFFSETGCITARPRTFTDMTAIFGPEMTPYWSGAIVYEWIEESNDYGIISYGPKVDPASPGAPPDGFTRSGTPTPINPDFTNLQNQWKTLNPVGVKASNYNPTLTPPPCPAYTSGVWNVNGNVALPSIGQVYNAQVASSIATGAPAASATQTTSSSKAGTSTSAGTTLSGSSLISSSLVGPSSTTASGMAKKIEIAGFSLASVLFGFFWFA